MYIYFLYGFSQALQDTKHLKLLATKCILQSCDNQCHCTFAKKPQNFPVIGNSSPVDNQ